MRKSSHLRFGLIVFIFICLGAGIADAQYFGRNKVQYKNFEWQVLSTPHFEIHFYKGAESLAARTALLLEDSYQMLAEKLQTTLPWKVPIILYASQNDFQQTNVSSGLIPEGLKGFAEPSRKRVVLPFEDSFKDFSHTAIHELSHVFTFNIVYNRLLDSVFSRNYLFAMPLWIAEGVAEYLSIGWDPDSDMFIRDAIIYNYIMELEYVGGYYVYKEGQSVFNYIADNYGKQKVLEILDVLATTRNGNATIEATLGLSIRELGARWMKSLRKHYWALYRDKMDVDDIGRRLTNHVKSYSYYNTKPVLSPDGETIAYFSDRGGLISINLMSALDGEIIKKLVTGSKSKRFESLHSFSSSLCFSPGGDRIAFIAKSKGRDALFIMDVNRGKVVQTIDIHASGLAAPDWSPVEDKIVLTATFNGQTDLVLVDVRQEGYRRLTNDVADQLVPRFFPDGKRIVFTYYPEVTTPVPVTFAGENKKILNEMDFLKTGNVRHDANLDIYVMDLHSAAIRPVVTSPGDDNSPVVMNDGRTIIYTSDESGINNLHLANLETGEQYRFTDIMGGIFTPDVHEEKGRITFSAFVHGGWDIFISDDLDNLIKRRYKEDVLDEVADADEEEPPAPLIPAPGPPAEPSEVIATMIPDEAGFDSSEVALELLTSADAEIDSILPDILPLALREPKLHGHEIISDSSLVIDLAASEGTGGTTRPEPAEEIKTRGATVAPYKTRLAPDYIGQGAGFYYSTSYGFGLANTVVFSDMLGDHRLMFSFGLYRDIENSDFLVSYFFLKNRINYGVGAFQFKNYLNSKMSTIGEGFSDYRLFSERNYGVYGLMSIPFSTFKRLDFELQALVSQREFYQSSSQDLYGNYLFVPTDESQRQPSWTIAGTKNCSTETHSPSN